MDTDDIYNEGTKEQSWKNRNQKTEIGNRKTETRISFTRISRIGANLKCFRLRQGFSAKAEMLKS